LTVTLTDRAKEYIVDEGYDPVYGARPLKRFIQSQVETLIARIIVRGDVEQGNVLEVDYNGEKLVVNTKTHNQRLV